MDEFNRSEEATSETDDRREIIKQKLRQYYDGRIVRKDLTKSIREGANVPVYVLEYLLGQYCNSDDQEIIDEGVDNVKRILRDNYVRPVLCSWNRRKALFTVAKEHGCNKIALGHHMDDILETLLMNITYQGAFSTMPPRLVMKKFDMTIIRPMCLVHEADLVELAALRHYQKQVKNCPYESQSSRSDMKGILRQLEAMNPEARYSLWGSMTNVQEDLLPDKID